MTIDVVPMVMVVVVMMMMVGPQWQWQWQSHQGVDIWAPPGSWHTAPKIFWFWSWCRWCRQWTWGHKLWRWQKSTGTVCWCYQEQCTTRKTSFKKLRWNIQMKWLVTKMISTTSTQHRMRPSCRDPSSLTWQRSKSEHTHALTKRKEKSPLANIAFWHWNTYLLLNCIYWKFCLIKVRQHLSRPHFQDFDRRRLSGWFPQ